MTNLDDRTYECLLMFIVPKISTAENFILIKKRIPLNDCRFFFHLNINKFDLIFGAASNMNEFR